MILRGWSCWHDFCIKACTRMKKHSHNFFATGGKTMKTWLFFMTLLLTPFWTFGKEKSKDNAEKDKLPFQTCQYLILIHPEFFSFTKKPCDYFDNEMIPFEMIEQYSWPNDNANNMFINYLQEIGVLSHGKILGNDLCNRHEGDK